jgi:hypothetical protein
MRFPTTLALATAAALALAFPAHAQLWSGTPLTGGTTTTTTTVTRDATIGRAYAAGKARNPRVQPADSAGWHAVARMTPYAYDDLVASYDQIHVVRIAYQQLLGRRPDSTGAILRLNQLKGGMPWQSVWTEIAHSPEREQKTGRWAPAYYATPDQARAAFGLPFTPTPEQCFGALGDKCEGGIPPLYPTVQPTWTATFVMPDGTKMGYVDIGVAVGSILHDNTCFRDRSGLNCNGIDFGADLTKNSAMPAAMEWSKAVWNVVDGRTWRERFGPYPVDAATHRASWYDDVRPVPTREAWMAKVSGMVAEMHPSVQYTGAELRETQRLKAPANKGLDEKDGAFCRSGSFVSVQTILLKTWGVCR